MDLKRKAARGIAVLAVALGAGHLVQTMANKSPSPTDLASAAEKRPQNVVPLAAGPETAPLAVAAPPLPNPLPVPNLAVVADPTPTPASAVLPEVATAPEQTLPQQTAACDITLDLMAAPSAMIGVTLLAPCHPNERVVLKHAGLAIAVMTTAGGALFTEIPALDASGQVSAVLADGTQSEAAVEIVDLASYRRFGVQWQGDDAFQVHGFENAANYGQPGDINAANPGRPVADAPSKGGFLTALGDGTAQNPLFAEIYTYPLDPTIKSEIVIEAAVTEKTCGRELLGETLASSAGAVVSSELTLSMPECDAVGDYLVLKNLAQDVTIAAAN